MDRHSSSVKLAFTMDWWAIAIIIIVIIIALLVVYYWRMEDKAETYVPSMDAAIPYQFNRHPGLKIYDKDKTTWLPNLEQSFIRDYPASAKQYRDDPNTTVPNKME